MKCPKCNTDSQTHDNDGFTYWQLEVRAHLKPSLNPKYCTKCKTWIDTSKTSVKCPDCGSDNLSLTPLDDSKYICKDCGKWFD